MIRDTGAFIAACPACSKGRSSHQPLAGLLNPLRIPRRLWSQIVVGFLTGLPLSHGHAVTITVVDHFSKAAHFVLLPKLPSAVDTGARLVQHVFRLHVLDRGPNFTSQVWRSFCSALGVAASLSSGYHPRSNGHAQRANQSLESALQCVSARHPASWSRFLTWVKYGQSSG